MEGTLQGQQFVEANLSGLSSPSPTPSEVKNCEAALLQYSKTDVNGYLISLIKVFEKTTNDILSGLVGNNSSNGIAGIAAASGVDVDQSGSLQVRHFS